MCFSQHIINLLHLLYKTTCIAGSYHFLYNHLIIKEKIKEKVVQELEIPYPTSEAEYSVFIWSILTFLVSFFIIAEFWYDNKRIFEALTEADHMVIVANFTFLASLALIPATTKWIMHQTTIVSVIDFGIVYLLTLLFREFLHYAVLRKRFLSEMGQPSVSDPSCPQLLQTGKDCKRKSLR